MATLTIFMVVVMTPVFVRHVSSLEQVTLDFKEEFRVSLTYLMLCLLAAGLTAFFGCEAIVVLLTSLEARFDIEKSGSMPIWCVPTTQQLSFLKSEDALLLLTTSIATIRVFGIT